jgi:hypothetical protein
MQQHQLTKQYGQCGQLLWLKKVLLKALYSHSSVFAVADRCLIRNVHRSFPYCVFSSFAQVLRVSFSRYVMARISVVSACISTFRFLKLPAHPYHPKKKYFVNVCVM